MVNLKAIHVVEQVKDGMVLGLYKNQKLNFGVQIKLIFGQL